MFAVFVVNTLYIKSLSFSSLDPCSHPFSKHNIYYMSVSQWETDLFSVALTLFLFVAL